MTEEAAPRAVPRVSLAPGLQVSRVVLMSAVVSEQHT